MKRQWNILIVLLMSLLLGACPSNQMAEYPSAGESTLSFKVLLPNEFQTSVWAALSTHFRLDDTVKHPLVKEQLDYLMRHQKYLNQLTGNAQPYLYYVYQQTLKRHMPAEIALLPMIESNYNPLGVSPASGATGLWQMMPRTASGYGIKMNWWYDGRRDIVASTTAALNYLAVLHRTFGNNWLLAIAAYNSGAGTVAMAIKHNQRLGLPTDYWSLPLPYETKIYIPRLLALANVISNAREYKMSLPNIPNKPYFKAVTLHNQVNINRVAELSQTSISTVRRLNPGFRHSNSAVPAEKSYTLLLPENKSTTNLAQLSSAKLILQPKNNLKRVREAGWIHHSIKSGESLYALADRYHTNVNAIKKANNLQSDLLHPGENILIPKHSNDNTILVAENSKTHFHKYLAHYHKHINALT